MSFGRCWEQIYNMYVDLLLAVLFGDTGVTLTKVMVNPLPVVRGFFAAQNFYRGSAVGSYLWISASRNI